MIEPPEPNKTKEGARRVAEFLAGFEPSTAALAQFFRFTSPGEFQRALDQWRAEVSSEINRQDERITELEAALQRIEQGLVARLRVGDLAISVALHLVETSEDGLRQHVEFEKVQEAFNVPATRELQEAVFELRDLGFLTTEAATSQPITLVRPQYALFWAFDPIVTRNDPVHDAAKIAREIVTTEPPTGKVAALHERTGWERRRFNPALAKVLSLFPEGRYSNEIQNTYPTTCLLPSPKETFALKRFIHDAEIKT